ncbi:MAG: hypothetical protein MUP14_07395, partial [Dehalococcoidia bacterium]|nr:hypothetical protein [Dehalococcoidia bacterium]
MPIRYLEKFTNIAGTSISYTFPLKAYEWESVEPLRTAFLESVGMDFAYDALRGAMSPRGVAAETVRFMIVGADAAAVDTALDDIRGKLLSIGRGKLYTVTAAGVRRWCYARLAGLPDIRVSVPAMRHAPAEVRFQRYSPWFAESITTVGATTLIDTSPKTISVTNAGNIPAKLVAIRFRADGAGGFTNPVLTNVTNGYTFSSTRDAISANSELKVDTEDLSVRWSNDNGVTYADDFVLFTIGALQASFFRLEP